MQVQEFGREALQTKRMNFKGIINMGNTLCCSVEKKNYLAENATCRRFCFVNISKESGKVRYLSIS